MRDETDLQAAMDTHGDMVYRLALCRLGNRADAEDIYQDVFIRYFRDATRFRMRDTERPGSFGQRSTAVVICAAAPGSGILPHLRMPPGRRYPPRKITQTYGRQSRLCRLI